MGACHLQACRRLAPISTRKCPSRARAGERMRPSATWCLAARLALAAVVAACSSSNAPPSPVPPGPLYVANYDGSSVTAYAAGATGNATPTVTIAGSNTGLNQPSGVALDAAGRVYVANFIDSVTIYATGANGEAVPTATITGSNTGLSQPEGIAFDAPAALSGAHRPNNR